MTLPVGINRLPPGSGGIDVPGDPPPVPDKPAGVGQQTTLDPELKDKGSGFDTGRIESPPSARPSNTPILDGFDD